MISLDVLCNLLACGSVVRFPDYVGRRLGFVELFSPFCDVFAERALQVGGAYLGDRDREALEVEARGAGEVDVLDVGADEVGRPPDQVEVVIDGGEVLLERQDSSGSSSSLCDDRWDAFRSLEQSVPDGLDCLVGGACFQDGLAADVKPVALFRRRGEAH